MLQRVRQLLVAAAGCLLAAAAVPPVVASDSAPAGGRAASSGTVLELSIAGMNLAINVDDLDARRAEEASASLTLGRSGTDEVGKVNAKRTDGTQRDDLGPDALALGTNIALNIAEGSAEASLEDRDHATATVTTTVVDASVDPGASAGQIQQTARAFAGTGHSRAVRTITIENLDVLSVQDLLDGLGLGALSLTCGQIESLATTVGGTASAACSMLSDVNDALTLSGDLLTGAEADAISLRDITQAAIDLQAPIVTDLEDLVSTLTSERDDLQADLAGLVRSEVEAALADTLDEIAIVEPVCTGLGLLCDLLATLTADADTYTAQIALFDQLDVVLADLAAAEADLALESAALDALLATLATANSVLDALAAIDLGGLPSCTDAADALAEVGSVTPSLAAAASTLADGLATACSTLADAVDELLDTSLLNLSGVEVTLDSRTKKGEATATIDGAIGSVQIGSLAPVALDLPVGISVPELDAASATLETTIEDVFTTTGLGSADVEITLFDIDRSSSVDTDGSSESAASMTVLSLMVDASNVTMPATPPLGALDGTLPGASETSGDVATSPLGIDLGMFEVSSSFPVASLTLPPPPPPGGGCSTCNPLPLTGTGSHVDAALLLLFMAAALGRFAREPA